MAFKRYTTCFIYPEGGKPYNENDRIAFAVTQIFIALGITGTFALVGLLGGPAGAIVAGLIGSVVGWTNLIDNAAKQWLDHRLICLRKDNPPCAVGIVSYNPTRSDLGAFDNDEYFDVVLMPHPAVIDNNVAADFDEYVAKVNPTALVPANRYKADPKPGDTIRDSTYAAYVKAHPANDIYTDGFQGQDLLSPRDDLEKDLGYAPLDSHERNALHCEAEGDFWVRVRKFAPVLAALIDAALLAAVAGGAAGATAGSALGCAIGTFLFGPLGCSVGAFFGGLFGGAAGAAAGGAGAYYGAINPILQAIFEASPGNVEDANVGDRNLGPIRMGDKVAVMGEVVYDGYHKGWHEFHPLMAVVKIGRSSRAGPEFYLEWQPEFSGTPPPKPPGETIDLTSDDMKQGLNSAAFRKRCLNLRDTWCRMLSDAFSESTRQNQQALQERWTIHPFVDGCRQRDDHEPPPIH